MSKYKSYWEILAFPDQYPSLAAAKTAIFNINPPSERLRTFGLNFIVHRVNGVVYSRVLVSFDNKGNPSFSRIEKY